MHVDIILVQTDEDVTAYAGSDVDFGFQVQLDTDHESGLGQLTLVVDGTLQEVAFKLMLACLATVPGADGEAYRRGRWRCQRGWAWGRAGQAGACCVRADRCWEGRR